MVAIYGLQDPRTGAIRYVGKAKHPNKRLISHQSERRTNRKCRWLAELRRLGLMPVLVILEEVEDRSWRDAETGWIRSLRDAGVDLCNHTSGGDGLHDPDAETRALISRNMRHRWDTGREAMLVTARSPPRRAAISSALSGRKSPWTASLPQNQPGRRLSERARAAISRGLMGNQRALGTTMPAEAVERLRLRMIGNQNTLDRVMPERERIARSVANTGQKRSPQTCLKQREAALRRWARTSIEDRRAHVEPALKARMENANV